MSTALMDTVSGAVITDRVALGIFLAFLVILIETVVLYKLGWAADLTASSAVSDQASPSDLTPGKQFAKCLRDSVFANAASAAVGWLLAQYVIFIDFWSVPFWLIEAIISITVEFLILWALRHKSIGKTVSAVLAMNAASYVVLVVIFGLSYEFGLATRI